MLSFHFKDLLFKKKQHTFGQQQQPPPTERMNDLNNTYFYDIPDDALSSKI